MDDRAMLLVKIRAQYDAAVNAANAAEDTRGQSPAVGTVIGTTLGLFGRLVDVIADLDQEVAALREQLDRQE